MHGRGVKTDPQGNIFEGEWREGKPVMSGKDKGNENGMLMWLNEAVANVTSIGRGGGEYQNVSTHDDDDEAVWRSGKH